MADKSDGTANSKARAFFYTKDAKVQTMRADLSCQFGTSSGHGFAAIIGETADCSHVEHPTSAPEANAERQTPIRDQ
jgi:hypothetical protein